MEKLNLGYQNYYGNYYILEKEYEIPYEIFKKEIETLKTKGGKNRKSKRNKKNKKSKSIKKTKKIKNTIRKNKKH